MCFCAMFFCVWTFIDYCILIVSLCDCHTHSLKATCLLYLSCRQCGLNLVLTASSRPESLNLEVKRFAGSLNPAGDNVSAKHESYSEAAESSS